MNIGRLLCFEKQALLKSYSEIHKRKHDFKIWQGSTLDYYQNDPHSYSKSSMMFWNSSIALYLPQSNYFNNNNFI